MARIARVIVPGCPHHVTQRGNRRQRTFLCEEDYAYYVETLREQCRAHGVLIWGWCLMPNHVHLIAAPASEVGLRLAVGNTHWRYTRRVNFREGWRGYLWQGRFSSCPLDDDHLLVAARYVDLNPVRAGLVAAPEAWAWSSAAARISGKADPLLDPVCPLTAKLRGAWREFLAQPEREEQTAALRRHERTGRPLGSETFVERISGLLGRDLEKRKPGRRPKEG